MIIDVIDGHLNAGDHIVLRLGDRRSGGPETRVQTFVEDGFKFRADVDRLGTSRFVAVPGDLSIKVMTGPPERVLLQGPRFAQPGVPTNWRVTLQDRWGAPCKDEAGEALATVRRDDEKVATRTLAWPAEGSASTRLAERPPSTLHRARCNADLHVHAHDRVGTNRPAYNAACARDIGESTVESR